VDVGGSSLPAVRVELNPTRSTATASRRPPSARRSPRPTPTARKASLDGDTRHWQIAANDQAKKAADYMPIIVAYRKGAAVRLTDIATVTDSVQDLRNAGLADGRPAVLLLIRRQPGANVIETVDRVKALLPVLQASIPRSINLQVASDSTTTIRASLREVERTLLISISLVIMVVFLFLRRWRAALIPASPCPSRSSARLASCISPGTAWTTSRSWPSPSPRASSWTTPWWSSKTCPGTSRRASPRSKPPCSARGKSASPSFR
jgi:multidrug efflux pump